MDSGGVTFRLSFLKNTVTPGSRDENAATCEYAVKEQLTALGELAARAGFRVIVMLIPMRHQVVPSSWNNVKEYYRRLTGDDLQGFDLDLPSRQLAEIAAVTGLPLLDLTGPFRSTRDPARLYFKRDQHWTREGHAPAAQVLARFIEKRPSLVARR